MDTISIAQFRALAESRGGLRVSIYMTTHPGGPEEFQDGVRLKTLLDQAERQLGGTGLHPEETRRFLRAARSLPESESFWHDRRQGLALFIEGERMQAFRLPLEFTELAAVSDRFITRHLLPLVIDFGTFLLLAITRRGAKLYRGDRFSLDEMPTNFPADVAQSLMIESADRSQQVHQGGTSGSRKQSAVFHGQGGESDADQRQLREYLRAIAHAIEPLLAHSREPLILAGVGYEVAEFKAICRYPHLVDAPISGNPTLRSRGELRAEAWKLVSAAFADNVARSIERYQQEHGRGTTSQDISEIVLAAQTGDLDTLIVDPLAQQWGHFDPASERIIVHESYQPMDHDLIDEAIVRTFLAKGTIRFASAGQVPAGTGGGLAAIYRKGRVPRPPRLVGADR
jgi:hypothetical protein